MNASTATRSVNQGPMASLLDSQDFNSLLDAREPTCITQGDDGKFVRWTRFKDGRHSGTLFAPASRTGTGALLSSDDHYQGPCTFSPDTEDGEKGFAKRVPVCITDQPDGTLILWTHLGDDQWDGHLYCQADPTMAQLNADMHTLLTALTGAEGMASTAGVLERLKGDKELYVHCSRLSKQIAEISNTTSRYIAYPLKQEGCLSEEEEIFGCLRAFEPATRAWCMKALSEESTGSGLDAAEQCGEDLGSHTSGWAPGLACYLKLQRLREGVTLLRELAGNETKLDEEARETVERAVADLCAVTRDAAETVKGSFGHCGPKDGDEV